MDVAKFLIGIAIIFVIFWLFLGLKIASDTHDLLQENTIAKDYCENQNGAFYKKASCKENKYYCNGKQLVCQGENCFYLK